MVVDKLAGLQIERHEPRRAKAVITVVDRPQPIAAIDDNTEHGVEKMRLYAAARVRDGGPGAPFQQLVALWTRLRVNSEKDAAVPTDRDVTYRFGITEDFLKRSVFDHRQRGHIRIRLAPAVQGPQNDRCGERNE